MVAEDEIWIFAFLISARFKDEGEGEILFGTGKHIADSVPARSLQS
jgi:hypothetical protein